MNFHVNPLFKYDQELLEESGLIGVDEAGRGSLAGPVVAAAAWISSEFYENQPLDDLAKINDSKMLSSRQREIFWQKFNEWKNQDLISFAWAQASVVEIEVCNILGATHLAMRRALDLLAKNIPKKFCIPHNIGNFSSEKTFFNAKESLAMPIKVLIDGKSIPSFDYKHEGIIAGDKKSLAIAIASIIAKVNRDKIMIELDKEYPAYGFAKNKGYGTQFHADAIMKFGETEEHRSLFLTKLYSKSGKQS